jgi:hypothetical protein
MPIAALALLCPFENRDATFGKDPKMVNAYGEIEDQLKNYAVKRPGYVYESYFDMGTQVAHGVAPYLGVLRGVVHNQFWRTYMTSSGEAINVLDTELVDFI